MLRGPHIIAPAGAFFTFGLNVVKAIALLSGGLDSLLAIRVVQQHGVEIEALHFTSIFNNPHNVAESLTAAAKGARMLGVRLTTVEFSKEMLEMVKHPRHGHGKNLNPCIDCHMTMLKRAAEFMRDFGAQFIITGEVLGQRPMSQHRNALQLIAKHAGVPGLILRPLSAKVLDPTIPETEGWVDREKLLGISGRSRKVQMAEAKLRGVVEYPAPAGGCLLTDEAFCRKLKDLIDHGDFDLNDVNLLKSGRHYRPAEGVKIIIGRDHGENEALQALARDGDSILRTVDVPGPLTLVRGECDKETLALAADLTARYSQGRDEKRLKVSIQRHGETDDRVIEATPCDLEKYKQFLIT
jgi:hypothetical protein